MTLVCFPSKRERERKTLFAAAAGYAIGFPPGSPERPFRGEDAAAEAIDRSFLPAIDFVTDDPDFDPDDAAS